MPYTSKGKCVYKKDTGEKVGCTNGSVKKYLAALHTNVKDENIQPTNEWESDNPDHDVIGFDAYVENGILKLARNTYIDGVSIPAGTPMDQVNKIWTAKKAKETQLREIIKKTIQKILKEGGLNK